MAGSVRPMSSAVELPTRQNTMELLDELPDLDSFLYPVDEFFPNYVQELGAQGLQQQGQRLPEAQPMAFELPPIPSTAGRDDPYMETGEGAYSNTAEHNFDSADEDNTGKPKRGNGKTRRNAKQQIQNKQAQQRYRERRKARFHEMEAIIDQLSAKVQELQAVQSQNQLLQRSRSELQSTLAERDEQVARLKQDLQLLQRDEGPQGEASSEQRSKTNAAQLDAYRTEKTERIQSLAAYLDEHSLRNANPTGEGVDAGVVQALADLVQQVWRLCQQVMRAEGVKVLDLMTRDMNLMSRIQCLRQREKWTHILEMLALTKVQQEQLLLMRKNHLRALRQVYEERQRLNMQAMALMLPPPGSASGECDIEGKMACMSVNGYSYCARKNVDLDEVLDLVKQNLRLEQKKVMEMNFVTIHRVLSPIQAALFMIEVGMCDCLALANILANVLHLTGAGSDELKSAGSGGDASENGVAGDGASSENGRVGSDKSHSANSDTCPLLQQS